MPTTTLAVRLVALLVSIAETPASTGRWDPQWLEILVVAAVLLVTAAVVWWLFLVIRVQDWWRDSSSYRRKR